jgi:hypothetical protein
MYFALINHWAAAEDERLSRGEGDAVTAIGHQFYDHAVLGLSRMLVV